MKQSDELVWISARISKQLKTEVRIAAALADLDISEFLRLALRNQLDKKPVRVVEVSKGN